jgi:hypothetical protein
MIGAELPVMNVNWSEIVKKYPKLAKMFEQKYSDFKIDCKYIPGLNLAFSISNSGIYQYDTALCPSREIGFDIFYVLCEKFFDEKKIEIIIEKILIHGRMYWQYRIYFEEDIYISYLKYSRDEAKEQAVLKSFEIGEKLV